MRGLSGAARRAAAGMSFPVEFPYPFATIRPISSRHDLGVPAHTHRAVDP